MTCSSHRCPLHAPDPASLFGELLHTGYVQAAHVDVDRLPGFSFPAPRCTDMPFREGVEPSTLPTDRLINLRAKVYMSGVRYVPEPGELARLRALAKGA